MTDTNAGIDWVGVTTVSKVVNPGEGLMHWANKQGLNGKALKDARSKGTSSGTIVHRAFERIVKGEAQPQDVLNGVTDATLRAYLTAMTGWVAATEPDVVHSEFKLSYEPLAVRGRIDMTVRCKVEGCECYGEGLWIKDFKTGGHKLYKEAHLQGDGYRMIWEANLNDPSMRARDVRHLCGVEFITLAYDGTWKPHALLTERGDFACALALYRQIEQLERRLDAHYATLS